QWFSKIFIFYLELEIRQHRGILPKGTLLLTVEDPQNHVGSGGATLNALLVAAEHLSAQAGYTVVSSDVLQRARLLILHMGRDFLFDDCGRGFTVLPLEDPQECVESLTCNLDSLLDTLRRQLCPGSPPGVWICSTDMVLTLPTKPPIEWNMFSGALVISVPGTPSYAMNHGVYMAAENGLVRDIIYCGSEERIQQCVMKDQKVPLVSGIVFLSSDTAERFLNTLVSPPLDGCTYQGLDSGAEPLEVSLFLDVLMSMAQDVCKEDFLGGSPAISNISRHPDKTRSARALLWRELHDLPLKMVYVPDGCYEYMTLSPRDHIKNLTKAAACGPPFSKIAHSFVTHPLLVEDGSSVVNCQLDGEIYVGTGCVVQNCHLEGPLFLGNGCILTGIDQVAASELKGHKLTGIILQAHPIRVQKLPLTVYSILGTDDQLQSISAGGSSTYLNIPWEEFFCRTGICENDLLGTRCTPRGHSLLSVPLFLYFTPLKS
ncbi:hypothetical protein GDO86_008125, partial [Hymenochirus boettgeri]